VSQVILADGQGIFSFSCPAAGWWGFAALNDGNFTIKDPAGQEKGVELGAVLWLYLDPFPLAPK
jgi:cobalt/nickel transport protein